MASARKKQDERNLKILRDLVSLPHNKYCLDCNQRGPTYVNVTIGSFVCTKCSGLLRGLTPPHRVKSISMATFTSEEIDFVRNRGNEFCKKTFLGLYEGKMPSENRDEQQILDFMVDKYERRRYYMEPSMALKNGLTSQLPVKTPDVKQMNNANTENSKVLRLNGISRPVEKSPARKPEQEFIADFASADIFNNAANNNVTTQASFANFDNNPIFNSSSSKTNGMPPSTNMQSTPNHLPNNNINGFKSNVSSAPAEDRYAALKDLDNALKAQPTLDWNSGSNNSLCSSSTTAGSIYSSSSPQSSMYGSPSQSSQFTTLFQQESPATISNPFNGNGNMWGNTNGASPPPPMTNGNLTANPFRASDAFKSDPFKTDAFKSDPFATDAFKVDPFKVDPFKSDPFKSDPFKTEPFKMNGINGYNQGFQNNMAFPQVNGTNWTPNPFKVGATTNGHSSNPFL